MKFFIKFILLLVGGACEARVFDLKQTHFSSYLFATYGTPPIKDSPWVLESTADTSSTSYSSMLGGEFGFTYSADYFAWRLGFEIFKPNKLNGISASLNGTELYQIDSDITGYAPKLGLEIIPWTKPNRKVFIFGYVGSATVTMKNEYSSLTLAPNQNFTYEMTGTGSLMGGGMGFENAFFDTTTFVLELGYRTLNIASFSYSKDAAANFSGTAISKGDTVFKTDGSKRDLNLTSAYVTFGLRFWLN